MPVVIDAADEISRCIIFDRAFDESIHVDEMLWRFEPPRDDDGLLHESAVLRRFALMEADVHRIGCAIAARQNHRKQEPPSGPHRRYYCGFRSAPYSTLPTEGDGYKIQITHSPEGGEEAHVDVALLITVEGKSARAVRLTDASLSLAEPFGPAANHICECDKVDPHHPITMWGEDCLTKGIPRLQSILLETELSEETVPQLPF